MTLGSRKRIGPCSLLLSVIILLQIPDVAALSKDVHPDKSGDVLGALKWRSIGPAVMGGRITDIEVVPGTATFFVATASGNLWKTSNWGTSWEALFEHEGTASIGDIALCESTPHVIWLGSGEANNRQSSPWGNGIYRSLDSGKTWTHMGLTETRHIGRVLVHPTDPDRVYVAAVGQLWGPNPERGVYRTIDGGKNWERVLYIDEDTGAIDLTFDPADPRTIFAAMYQRRRTAFGFNGGGPGSGIYRSRDGGDNWTELTEGLPSGDKGRIGLDAARQGETLLLYSIVEAGRGRSGVYTSTDGGDEWRRVNALNPRPMYYSQIRIDPRDPKRIYVLGRDLHVSDDRGESFRSDGAERTHPDHHDLWIDPAGSRLIMGGDGGLSVSFDRGEQWRMIDNLPIGQFYAIGVDMRRPYYVYGGLQDNGSWGGPSASLDRRGILNDHWFNVNGGDGFYMQVDPSDHNVIYSESQRGRIVRFDLETRERQSIQPSTSTGKAYRWNWSTPILVSSHDPRTIYVGANHLLRSSDRGFSWEETSPDLTRQIDRSTLEIMGAPETEMISRHDGIASYGNIVTISESQLDRNLIYVGTDDGNLQLTTDGGRKWSNLTGAIPGLPDQTHASRVVASRHDKATVYATFDGHRQGDFDPYVFRSRDLGRTWTAISDGLPEWSVNVIVEHPRTANLLILGNEIGVYYSINSGDSWLPLKSHLPTVPVDDLIVHPRDNDLVAATHGRSIWILEDIRPLEDLAQGLEGDRLLPVRDAIPFSTYRPQEWVGQARYSAPNPPRGALIRYVAAVPRSDKAETSSAGVEQPPGRQGVKLTIRDGAGTVIRVLEGAAGEGFQEVVWDLRHEPPYSRGSESTPGNPARGPTVLPGEYSATLDGTSQRASSNFEVLADPGIRVSREDLEARQTLLMGLYSWTRTVHEAGAAHRRLSEQLQEARTLVDQQAENTASLKDSVAAARKELGDLLAEASKTATDLGVRIRPGRPAGFQALRGFFSSLSGEIEGFSGRPTEAQLTLSQVAAEGATVLVERLNRLVSETLPGLNKELNRRGLRRDPGQPIKIPDPRRSSGEK